MKRFFLFAAMSLLFCVSSLPGAHAEKAQVLVEDAVNYLRGETSRAVVEMTIHRPDWERTMTIKAWTQARENSIFWIVSPPKDRGNGTLKRGDEMWIYNPKVNRVIKLPPSMMSQSWQGSDFSNNDLAKSDNIVDQYTHEIIGTETHEGKTVYLIRSLPKPGAPVVWGMQKLKIREDHILLRQAFFDEDRKLVKALTMERIEMLGGRLYPVKWKMQKAGQEEEYTVLDYQSLEFGVNISDRMFTIASLKNSRF
ncbi:outer membrane lipoprotein-sorting protein [Desulfosalsimonas propionicica]|uniref:Outer membrane lipoprotein-sorting protein n=1 Tax=Desulfosalsimonas propionicica TaxID=332175 RepID=A0A7W0CA99_9BACT|nr:outer membrane lipoprotein-sorting protein [Desulfosalsimonas propionicica]MBA2882059.1 outer membrane lipoprotein-sorting protein [Desulfosalsimonas propionicica]